MKKVFFFSIGVLLLFSSCKKDHNNQPIAAPKQKVTFTVSDFTSTIIGSANKLQTNSLKTNADIPLSAYADVFYYFVYGNNGTPVSYIFQTKTSPNFGTVSDNLPAGTYTVFMAAGTTGFTNKYYTVDHFNGLSYNPVYVSDKIGWTFDNWQDSYYSAFPLTVGSSDINQNVSLSRMDAQLEIDFKDVIPLNAQTIDLVLTNDYHAYDPLGNSPVGPFVSTNTTTVPAAAKGTTTFKIDNIVLNTISNFSVDVNCYDSTHTLIKHSSLTGIHCEKNTRTIVSGYIWGSNSNFTVTGGDWDPTPYITINF